MTTCGLKIRIGREKVHAFNDGTNMRKARFKYPEVCHNHYYINEILDNHNSRRSCPISIEDQWKTHWWPNRAFQFLVAIIEVNCNLVNARIFGGELEDQIEFRFSLGTEMVNNSYLDHGEFPTCQRRKDKVVFEHNFLSLPPYQNFRNGEIRKCKTRYIKL